jgi:hypothetical protein
MGMEYAGWGGPHASRRRGDEGLFLLSQLMELSLVASPVSLLAPETPR